jgi:AraC-like DNA-binding protein
MNIGPNDAVYPAAKIALMLDALAARGASIEDALRRVRLSKTALSSPATRVSLNRVIDCCCCAMEHSQDAHFAFHTGLRFHVAAYGMYGFAILSSVNYRETMQFAAKYHQLATPLTTLEFTEDDGCGIWLLEPLSHPRINANLRKFIIEMQFGIVLALHRDIMGASFLAREFHVTYPAPHDAQEYPARFGAPVLFGQPTNKLVFDSRWLDGTPSLGNEITYSSVVSLCEAQIEELQLRKGVVGEVRQILMKNLMRPKKFQDVAHNLNMSARTLRRKLQEENSSFRGLVDELRRDMAIQYLRDTALTVEDIAETLGFSDAANFRHAFRRWAKSTPHEFKNAARGPDRGFAPWPAIQDSSEQVKQDAARE